MGKPHVLFRIAIEEMEAWLLGDREAVLREFPRAKQAVLNAYVQDSVCGTWETLADAVFPGGHKELKRRGFAAVGKQECSRALHRQLPPPLPHYYTIPNRPRPYLLTYHRSEPGTTSCDANGNNCYDEVTVDGGPARPADFSYFLIQAFAYTAELGGGWILHRTKFRIRCFLNLLQQPPCFQLA